MARARNIKPALFKNEVLGVADPLLTLLFEGLWVLADRDGRLEDRPMRIKAEIFPYRESLKIENLLDWLHCNDFIIRYQYGKDRYIQVNNFAKHQNPHKNEAASEIPEYSITCASTEIIGTSTDKIGSAPADSLSLDSLSSDSPLPVSRAATVAKAPSLVTCPPGVSAQVWTDFTAHRKSLKKPLTQLAADRIASKLTDHMYPDEVLNQSIANGWAGIFPEKTNAQHQQIAGQGRVDNSAVGRVKAAIAEREAREAATAKFDGSVVGEGR